MLCWKLLLYANSTRCSLSSQLPLKYMRQACNMSSKVCIVLSDCPSVCGWKAVLYWSLVLKVTWRLRQKFDVNRGSQSDVNSYGDPVKPYYLLNVQHSIFL